MLPSWTLTATDATLHIARFQARLNLARPDEGLHVVAWDDAAGTADRLLAVRLAGGESAAPLLPDGHYLRGADLVAAYGESAQRPLQTDIVWRALDGAGVELIVSVRTSLWDSRPMLDVVSAVAADEVLGLDAGGFLTPLASGLGSETTWESPQPGCLVYRLAGSACSYVEMVHPVDFRHGLVRRPGAPSAPAEVTYRLFPDSLEKGVILRARLRGLLLARRDDAARAATLYAAFAAGEPPLASY